MARKAIRARGMGVAATESRIDATPEAGETRRLRDEVARLAAEIADRDRLIADQERALAHGAKIFARSSEAARIGVWECELPLNRLTWTDGVYDIFELPRGAAVTREQAVRFYEPGSLAELDRLRTQAIRACGGFTFDARIRTARGNDRWMRITATVETENGAPVRIFGMKQDITEEKILQDRTRFLAECDVLTGLANRSRFQAALSAVGAGAGALLLVDLDGFKHVNDTFGHAAGDACLCEIADRLRAIAPPGALVARIGGDEFAVLVEGFEAQDAEALGRRIVAAARAPILHEGQSYQIGASVGIAAGAGEGDGDGEGEVSRPRSGDLQGDADLALYAAKAAGKDRVALFHPGLRAHGSARAQIIGEVAAAHDEGRLALVYQPIVDVRDGRVCAHEALLRRRRPDGSLAEAASFAPALRDPDLARRLDDWVLHAALEQAGRWRRAGEPVRGLAVNIGAGPVREPGFAERVLSALARERLVPGDLTLEIAESAFAEAGDALGEPLARLRAAGIRIALDDFGIGATALTAIGRLPVDVLKIEGALVRRLDEPAERVVVEALVHLARGFRFGLVAEGVETEGQRARVAEIGITHAQGWLYGFPQAAERVVCGTPAMRCA